MSDVHPGGDGYYEETEDNRAFAMEWEARKQKQDGDLDVIEKGLGNLQNIAQDMGAEVNKQDVLLDEIETQVRLSTPRQRGSDCSLFTCVAWL
jgi:t-SNARE complex subunit (syntaxin)